MPLILLVIFCCTLGLAHARPKAKKHEPCIGVPLYTRHEIRMVMRANLWRVCICYETADHWPQRKGAPKAHFNIARSGATTKVRVEGTKNARLKECLTGAVRKIRFPPWRYQSMVEMIVSSYPLFVHRFSPDGRVPPKKVEYRTETQLAVTEAEGAVTVTLRKKAREALASLRGFRLPTVRDLEPKARIASGFPYPFAVVDDFNNKQGADLAIALVNEKDPGRWRLVVLHSRRAARGYTLVTVASSDKIRGRFPKLAAFSVTKASRCFCRRRCIAVASNAGKSLEYEWDGKRYVETMEHYLPRKGKGK